MIYLPIGYLRYFQFNTILGYAPVNTLDHFSWYKHARILKVLVSISTPMRNIWICIVSHLHQHLNLLKFLIFANIVGVKCYPVTVLICILITYNIENIFIISGVFVFALLWKGNACLYPLSIFYLAICFFFFVFARILYETIRCFFRCVCPSIKLKILEGKDCTFFILISPGISVVIQLGSFVFCR